MPFIKGRDINLYYEIAGQGPRLLFISGTGADLRNKPNIFDSPLTEHFEVLAFDQRGLGQTDRPDIPYSMADYAMDTAALLDALNWDSCNLLGISFGGMVAQEMAIRYPQCIKRLALCCTSSGGQGGDSYPFHKLANLSADEMDSVSTAIADTRHDKAWQAENPDDYRAIIEQSNSRNAGAGEPGRETGARRQLEARIGHNTFDRLPQINLPVFIAGGCHDGIAPPTNLEALHHQIKQSRLEFFRGGHDFYNHDALAYQRIIGFFRGRLDDK